MPVHRHHRHHTDTPQLLEQNWPVPDNQIIDRRGCLSRSVPPLASSASPKPWLLAASLVCGRASWAGDDGAAAGGLRTGVGGEGCGWSECVRYCCWRVWSLVRHQRCCPKLPPGAISHSAARSATGARSQQARGVSAARMAPVRRKVTRAELLPSPQLSAIVAQHIS
eukprot:COSAG03_NODE_30_length_18664_cov_5.381524_5_plen_167_part_00